MITSRAKTDIVPLMLRLREALRQRLAKSAERNGRSLNAEIIDRLEASYRQDERVNEFNELKELIISLKKE